MSYTQSHVIATASHDRTRGLPVLVVAAVVAIAIFLAGCGTDGPGAAPTDNTTIGDDAEETASSAIDNPDTMDDDSMPAMAMMTSIGSQDWEGMKVEIAVSEPTTFTLFQGDTDQQVTPNQDDSLHLMAVLSDSESGERIPYADLWVTVTSSSDDIVFDERLWPMLSRAMGTHYGINVALPAPGTYAITLQVGAPQGARHPEYADRWLEATSFDFDFSWSG